MDEEMKSEVIRIVKEHMEKLEDEAKKYRELTEGLDFDEGPDDWKRTENLAERLHNLYMGVEHIMERIAKDSDQEEIPDGPRWHQKLLKKMAEEKDHRPALFSNEEREELLDYLQFRHFYRRGYRIDVEWSEMEALVRDYEQVNDRITDSIQQFIEEIGGPDY